MLYYSLEIGDTQKEIKMNERGKKQTKCTIFHTCNSLISILRSNKGESFKKRQIHKQTDCGQMNECVNLSLCAKCRTIHPTVSQKINPCGSTYLNTVDRI